MGDTLDLVATARQLVKMMESDNADESEVMACLENCADRLETLQQDYDLLKHAAECNTAQGVEFQARLASAEAKFKDVLDTLQYAEEIVAWVSIKNRDNPRHVSHMVLRCIRMKLEEHNDAKAPAAAKAKAGRTADEVGENLGEGGQ